MNNQFIPNSHSGLSHVYSIQTSDSIVSDSRLEIDSYLVGSHVFGKSLVLESTLILSRVDDNSSVGLSTLMSSHIRNSKIENCKFLTRFPDKFSNTSSPSFLIIDSDIQDSVLMADCLEVRMTGVQAKGIALITNFYNSDCRLVFIQKLEYEGRNDYVNGSQFIWPLEFSYDKARVFDLIPYEISFAEGPAKLNNAEGSTNYFTHYTSVGCTAMPSLTWLENSEKLRKLYGFTKEQMNVIVETIKDSI